MGEPEEINVFEDYLNAAGFKDLNIHKSKPTYLEIMNSNASKANGIKRVIDLFNIYRNETVAIGDNFNDIDMLEFAGISIAMGNAPQEVKEVASIVTDTNNREGIKKALEALALF